MSSRVGCMGSGEVPFLLMGRPRPAGLAHLLLG